MTDIGFEDYYLLHDLCCHKTGTGNPDQFYVREALRIAYLFAIYNDGKLNELYRLYPRKFVDYLKDFDTIFTTNYDSNVDSVVEKTVYHIHGQFDKLASVYGRRIRTELYTWNRLLPPLAHNDADSFGFAPDDYTPG